MNSRASLPRPLGSLKEAAPFGWSNEPGRGALRTIGSQARSKTALRQQQPFAEKQQMLNYERKSLTRSAILKFESYQAALSSF
jgi:hypothetical protein